MNKVKKWFIDNHMWDRTPKRQLPNDIKENIIENGLIHYTDKNNLNRIMSGGLQPNPKKSMRKCERNMVWLYEYKEDKEYLLGKLHEINRGNRRNYNAAIIFLFFFETQLDNMKIKKNYDNVVAHLGILKTGYMKRVDDLDKYFNEM